MAGLTLDEEESLSSNTALLYARAEHETGVVWLYGNGTSGESKTPFLETGINTRAADVYVMASCLTGTTQLRVTETD